jgi:hypothetical protein
LALPQAGEPRLASNRVSEDHLHPEPWRVDASPAAALLALEGWCIRQVSWVDGHSNHLQEICASSTIGMCNAITVALKALLPTTPLPAHDPHTTTCGWQQEASKLVVSNYAGLNQHANTVKSEDLRSQPVLQTQQPTCPQEMSLCVAQLCTIRRCCCTKLLL